MPKNWFLELVTSNFVSNLFCIMVPVYKKEWFLDLFVGKFVILHQSFLKTYLSSGLFSDPSGSHFEELKSNFEEFDLSQFGDFLTLLALNR